MLHRRKQETGLAAGSTEADSSDDPNTGRRSTAATTSTTRSNPASSKTASLPGAAHRLPCIRAIASHCLVPAQASLTVNDEPAAVLMLLEGGAVAVHTLPVAAGTNGSGGTTAAQRAQQQQLGLVRGVFQGQPKITAARLRIIPIGRVPLQGVHGACMTSLRTWSAGLKAAELPRCNSSSAAAAASLLLTGCSSAEQQQWRWLLDGGRPAKPDHADGKSPYATLYCTGHQVSGVGRMHT